MKFVNLVLASLLVVSGMATDNEESHLRGQYIEESHPHRPSGLNRALRDQYIEGSHPRGPEKTENKDALNDVTKNNSTAAVSKKNSTAAIGPDKPPQKHKEQDEEGGITTSNFVDCGPYKYDVFVGYLPDSWANETSIKIWNAIDGYVYTEEMRWCKNALGCYFNVCAWYNELYTLDIFDTANDGMFSGHVYSDAFDGPYNFLGIICDLDTPSELSFGSFKEIPFQFNKVF